MMHTATAGRSLFSKYHGRHADFNFGSSPATLLLVESTAVSNVVDSLIATEVQNWRTWMYQASTSIFAVTVE